MHQNYLTQPKIEDQQFSYATRHFFYLLTLFGFRPFSMPGECCTIRHFSIIGLIFWLPAISMNGYMVHYFETFAVTSIIKSGFFNPQSVLILICTLCYVFLVTYLFLSFCFASKLRSLLEKLDTVILTPKSYKIFIISFRIGSTVCVIIAALLIYEIGISYISNFTTFMTYMSNLSFVFAVAAFVLPFMFLSVVSFFLYRAFGDQVLFSKNYPKSMIELQLPSLYTSYLDLADIFEHADRFFSVVTGWIVTISIVNICMFFLNVGSFTGIPLGAIGPWIFLMFVNFLGFSFVCTMVNDQSRALLAVLHRTLPNNHNIHVWLDAFHRKIADNSWGMTFYKFMLYERTAFLGLVSAMATFVAFYAQLSQSAPIQANSTSIDMLDFENQMSFQST